MSKIKKNGIINGGSIGIIYIGAIYILSSTISGNYNIGLNTLIMTIAALIAGSLGGIVGVNKQ